jgi:hypothetical protein
MCRVAIAVRHAQQGTEAMLTELRKWAVAQTPMREPRENMKAAF